MEYVYSIGLILLGIFLFFITYKDGKIKKATFTTDYIMHLKGYIGGIGAIILGILMLINALKEKG